MPFGTSFGPLSTFDMFCAVNSGMCPARRFGNTPDLVTSLMYGLAGRNPIIVISTYLLAVMGFLVAI